MNGSGSPSPSTSLKPDSAACRGREAKLCYFGLVPMKNRNGLVVEA